SRSNRNVTISSTKRVAKYKKFATKTTSKKEKNRICQNERRKKLRMKRQEMKREIASYKKLLNIKEPPNVTRKERMTHLPPKEMLRHMTMEELSQWRARSRARLKEKKRTEEMTSMEEELHKLEEMA
ncbi:hypothetical protein ACHAWF_000835, partial [Thalassiosira exigua]